MLVGVVALNAGNYLFHLIAARRLGPARYGDLATLVTLSSLIALPLGGVQIWVARYVAQRRTSSRPETIHWFARRVGVYLVLIGAAAAGLLVLLAWPIQQALGIASLGAVVLTALTVFPAVITPLPWGLAQGLERFSLIAISYASGPVARVVFVLAAFAAGMGVGGAMLATLASMVVALAWPVAALRGWWRPSEASSRDLHWQEALVSLVPVMAGLLAVTALTSDDVIVAKAALANHEAGIYGSASLVGRVILYLPSAIITVLLPRVAARVAGRQSAEDLLYRSADVTFAVCVVGTVVYAVAGSPITRVAFGAEYDPAAGLLWQFGIAMTGYALLNVLLIYHLGRDDSRLSWLLLGGAIAQLVLFAIVHGSPRQLIGVDTAVALALIIAHEVLIYDGLTQWIARPARWVFRRSI